MTSIETVQAQWFESRNSNLEVRTIPQGAIVVPGISGKDTPLFIYPTIAHRVPDSHAHILEYGAARQLPLEGAKTIRGGLFSSVDIPRTCHSALLQMLLLVSVSTSSILRTSATIHPKSSLEVVGITLPGSVGLLP
jgi:hypothetical protein